MELQAVELESAITGIKWVFPILSACFVAMVFLIIYILKGNLKILYKLVSIVDRLEKAEAVASFRMDTIEKNVDKLT